LTKDQHAEREAEKYERPIPSREYIMEILAQKGRPLSREQLAQALELEEPQDLDALRRRLRAMERDGQLIRNRKKGYGLVDKMDLVRGRVLAHPDGFGFLVPDEGGEDLFLSGRQMRQLFHRDKVLVHVAGIDRRGRREGAVVEVLERNTHHVVGRYYQDRGLAYVTPDNKRVTHEIVIPQEDSAGARNGQIVVVEIVEQPTMRRQPIGRVMEILGEHMAAGMEIDVAIRSHDIPFEWPQAVTDEADAIGPLVQDSAKSGREDLRELPLVTIDGADAKDFDDAVYCEPAGNNWRLFVAIADVAHYVRPGSALDDEAQNRGNSVYFPGRVIPMLPEILSNGLCSLRPEVDRLTMVCEMLVSNSGKIKSHRFYNAVIRSHARLIYDDVAALLAGDAALQQKYSNLEPHLRNLYSLYHALVKQRNIRGAIEFETTETVIEFGENKKIEKIRPLVRNDAHKIIEECMIAANVCAAQFLSENDMPVLYRVHDVPKLEKLTDLRDFLRGFGLTLGRGEKPEGKDYTRLLEQIQGRPDWHLIQTVMLRSLNQAVYSPDNVGHFGLALEEYAHFTSPIRRYPDLLVHRALKHVIAAKPPQRFFYNLGDMQSLGESCSMTERRADEATRDVVDWLKCEYMMDRVGEVFDGIVTSVTSFGLFVELENIYVEGLVHVTSLKSDYYHFDPVRHCLLGERSNTKYRLADRVQVQLVRVDLDDKKIDFELVSDLGPASADSLKTREELQKSSKRGKKDKNKDKKKDKARDKGKGNSRTKKKTAAARNTPKKKAPKQAGKKSEPQKTSSNAEKETSKGTKDGAKKGAKRVRKAVPKTKPKKTASKKAGVKKARTPKSRGTP